MQGQISTGTTSERSEENQSRALLETPQCHHKDLWIVMGAKSRATAISILCHVKADAWALIVVGRVRVPVSLTQCQPEQLLSAKVQSPCLSLLHIGTSCWPTDLMARITGGTRSPCSGRSPPPPLTTGCKGRSCSTA